MSCPYCGDSDDVVDGFAGIIYSNWPWIDVFFNAHCGNKKCGKRSKQQYTTWLDDYGCGSVKEEVFSDL